MTTWSQVRQAISTRAAELVADASYKWAPEDRWHEAILPTADGVALQPGTDAHLAFFADDSVIDRTFFVRGNAREGVLVTVPMVLRFVFQVRLHNEIADWDACADAATAMCRHLIDWAAPPIDLNVRLASPVLERVFDLDAKTIDAAIGLDVDFSLSLSAS